VKPSSLDLLIQVCVPVVVNLIKVRRGDPEMANRKAASKREEIDTGRDKRYVRRDDKGQFKESDDVGRSLSQDVRKKAATKVPAGQGDRGDQERRS
jgi:hypothetical protein